MQDAHNAGRKGYWSLFARITVATVAILWVLWGQNWGKLSEVFVSLKPWHFLLSLAIYVAAQVAISIRWWLLLRAQSIHIDIWAAIRLFFLGLFYNNVMPGAVGGDLLKAWYVTKHTHRRLEGALSVLVDRVIGFIGLVLMAVFTYAVFVRGQLVAGAGEQTGGLERYERPILWAGVAVAAVLTGVLAYPPGRRKLVHMAKSGWVRGALLLRRVKEAIVVYCSKPWTLLGTMVLTFIGQSIVIVAFWFLGRDLGVEAGLKYYFVVFPLTWVIGAIPISVAGLGITEAGTVGLFVSLAGVTPEKALALAFCQRFIWVLSSLPGGLVHLLGAHLPEQEISVDGPERRN